MLADRTTDRPRKKVRIEVPDGSLRLMLGHLLEEWGYLVDQDAEDGVVVVAYEGHYTPDRFQPVIWLSDSHYSGLDRLSLPLRIESLYTTLERKFHQPPRRHLRIGLDVPAVAHCRGQDWPVRLTCLSDRGCRMLFPRELARDEAVRLSFSLNECTFDMEGLVLYSFPARPDREGGYGTGLLFLHLERELNRQLRGLIVNGYFDRIRSRCGEEAWRQARSFLFADDLDTRSGRCLQA
ncbi:MAG: PilZ domain-containing protein [Deltaproteobacteria bacterium]|nr:MAG: PilZ domain-containing protein [Deltaproteobacteria bacterium]